MEPRIESLLDREDSKFTLVTLAAMRAREINDYYNQLGEGLGKIVPPQVTSVSRKPLSIALEEIEVGKIIKAEDVGRGPRVEAEADPGRTTPAGAPMSRSWRRSGAGGWCSVSPVGSPRTRRSRCAGGSSMPAPGSARSSPRTRRASSAR